MRLTPRDRARYERDGFVGPLRGWEEDVVGRIAERLLARLARLGLMDDTWDRLNLHTRVPEVAELATGGVLVESLASVLGPDLLLFETHVGVTSPTDPGPRWHRHLYPDWQPQPSTHCVARIGLTAEPEGHCHRFIPASALPPNDEEIEAMLRDGRGADVAVSIPLRPGEFVLFDGGLPHCAGDREDGRAPLERVTQVVRVATPSQRLGTLAETGQCFLLRGRDERRHNRCTPLAAR